MLCLTGQRCLLNGPHSKQFKLPLRVLRLGMVEFSRHGGSGLICLWALLCHDGDLDLTAWRGEQSREEESLVWCIAKVWKIISAVQEWHINGYIENIWRFKFSDIPSAFSALSPWHSLAALLDSCWIYTPSLLKSHCTESSEPRPRALYYSISGI